MQRRYIEDCILRHSKRNPVMANFTNPLLQKVS